MSKALGKDLGSRPTQASTGGWHRRRLPLHTSRGASMKWRACSVCLWHQPGQGQEQRGSASPGRGASWYPCKEGGRGWWPSAGNSERHWNFLAFQKELALGPNVSANQYLQSQVLRAPGRRNHTQADNFYLQESGKLRESQAEPTGWPQRARPLRQKERRQEAVDWSGFPFFIKNFQLNKKQLHFTDNSGYLFFISLPWARKLYILFSSSQ
jgi:hypothetical protein